MPRIGVISDTHNLFDPKIPKLFAGVDHILHAGDIGRPSIILQLEDIAPVTAVLGNTDDSGMRFRETELFEIDGRKFLIHHIVNPNALTDSLQERIAREKPDAVIFGHTHKPFCETIDGTLYFNPGSAGQARFGLPRTLAILTCAKNGIRTQYFDL